MEQVKKFIREHPHMCWGLYLPVYLTMFFIIEHLITDNYWATQTAIDDYIPFCEWFVFPYDSWSFLLVGFNIFGSAFFTALGNGAVSACISFLRTLLFQVAAVLLLPLVLKVDGIWLAIVVAETLALLVTVSFFLRKREEYGYA